MRIHLLFTFLLSIIVWSVSAQVTSVGLIGSATNGGWDNDTPMSQVDDSTWIVEVSLKAGEAKFRANGAWDINWGAVDFPSGIGTQGGPNIPIPAGLYTVVFNSNSGEYNFGPYVSDIGIIGSATAGGWDEDTDLFPDAADTNVYTRTLDLVQGEAKFRADNDWALSWGDSAFPSGVGSTNNGPNIPIPKAGTYNITFNKATGEYNFEEVVTYASIGLIGSATPGGWDTETPMNQDLGNPDLWKLDITLVDGDVKFRANNNWDVSWGGADFPIGVATSSNGPNIPATAGDYRVTFNTETGEYSFLELGNYTSIGIIGDATPGGWNTETPMVQDANDKVIWRVRLDLLDGEAKFRANNDWPVNWGSGDFPSGVGTQDGANIPVLAGDYKITMNTLTGEYNFEAVIEYDAVGLIGKSGPNGDWANDYFLDKDADNGNLWKKGGVTLTTFDPADTDGSGVKFRANSAWDINWGAQEFPIGTGVQNGKNIECVAGTYDVSFRADTGEYGFLPSSGTSTPLTTDAVIINPNPASDYLNIELTSEKLTGVVNYVLVDMSGKKILQGVYNTLGTMKLNLENVGSGNYLLHLSNEKYFLAKKVIVLK